MISNPETAEAGSPHFWALYLKIQSPGGSFEVFCYLLNKVPTEWNKGKKDTLEFVARKQLGTPFACQAIHNIYDI